jgi:hypothetical protein
MIGPGDFLLMLPTDMQFQLQFYWWGCKKKEQLNLEFNLIIQHDILSTGGDSFTYHRLHESSKSISTHAKYVTLQLYCWHPRLGIYFF